MAMGASMMKSSQLRFLAYSLLAIASVGFFVFPAMMSFGLIDPKFMDGLLFLELGLVVHSIFFMFLAEIE
jgi:hypothetical protein